MNARPRKAARLTVSLDPADYDALSRIAQQRDVSMSWVIRQAIRQFARREPPPKTLQKERYGAGPSR
jgi:predicted transcriptional regulator